MLTVIVPAYNHEDFIIECLESLIKIKLPAFKVIVIDDGSVDSTAEKVSRFIEVHPWVPVELVTKKNAGLVSSLNLGLEMSAEGYIYFVASDDIPCPEGLVSCIEALDSDLSLNFCVGGGVNFFEEDGRPETPIYGAAQNNFFKMKSSDREAEMFLRYPSPILLQSTVFRVTALKTIGGWDSKFTLDDFPTFVKLLSMYPECDQDFLFKPEINVVRYRQHGSNSYKNMLRHFKIVRQSLIALAPAYLKPRALGTAVGFYTLVALKRLDIRTALSILFSSGVKAFGYALMTMASLICAKAKHYIVREGI